MFFPGRGLRHALLLVALCCLAAGPGAGARSVHRSAQESLGPDYAARRRIRDVEADIETADTEARAAADAAAAGAAADSRFIETHAAAARAGTLQPPGSDEEATANAIKAKLMMQAESLGITNANDYAANVVQQAVDQEEGERPSDALSEEAIRRAEIELAGMFSGVIGAVMGNVMRERPDLLGGSEAPDSDEL